MFMCFKFQMLKWLILRLLVAASSSAYICISAFELLFVACYIFILLQTEGELRGVESLSKSLVSGLGSSKM